MNKDKEKIDKEFDETYMDLAAQLSFDNIDRGGGPFGAVIVDEGGVVATGVNSVTLDNDPTAHAEVNAIRNACRKIGSFQLKGMTVYSSCEPCPMCLSALYWAGVKKIYYGNTKEDAAAIDFSDKFIYDEIERRPADRHVPGIHVDSSKTIRAFEKWAADPNKVKY